MPNLTRRRLLLMKNKLSNILFILLCIVLLAASLCMGAVRGWRKERNEVLSAMAGGGELRTQLEYRGMDAANLAVVAGRHLPADHADLLALRQASAVLLSDTDDVQAILDADAIITAIARAFAEELPALPSLQDSVRDQAYIRTLTGALGTEHSLSVTYAELTADYNHRLSTSLTGMLATLLGVEPLPTAATPE